MNQLVIRLLGGFEVLDDGCPVTSFESASSRALLARLAATPRVPVPRAALAELLWPERPAGGGLANLRHTLSVVRRAIGDHRRDRPVLATTADSVSFDPAADVVVDLSELRRLAATPASSSRCVAAWEEAVQLRRGPFLGGFERSFSPEWDLWVEATRAEVDELTTSTLRRLAELRERSGEHDRVRQHVAAWLAIDRWDERAHRIAIRQLAEDGRAAAAVAHGDELVSGLRDELGVEPATETVALIEEIRRGGEGVSSAATTRPTDPRSSPACVGRDHERSWLAQRLDRAVLGRGSVAFVVGEAGVGKTVLLDAFVADARSRMGRLASASGTCNAFAGRGDPLFPFRRILQTLLADVTTPDLVLDLAEIVLDDGPDLLGSLIGTDELAARLDELDPCHPLASRLRASTAALALRAGDPARRQFPLLDQCAQVLTRLATRHPLLLVVDDLQWADDGTLDLLGHLATMISDVPLLLVAALRPPDVAGDRVDDRLGALVSDIDARTGGDATLELSGSREFVDAWLDLEPNLLDEGFRARLHRLTGGHPLFTVETVDALREHDHLRRDRWGRWVVGEPGALSGLPPRVDATIGARLARLPGQLRLDLDAASVQGDVFAAEVVAAVRGVPTDDVVRRLSAAGRSAHSVVGPAGPIELGSASAHGWRFRHGLFRQHLYDHLAAADRASLHGATATALADAAQDRLDDIAVELADHFDRAAAVPDAIEAHGRAGRRVMRLGATRDAANHFERALDLLARQPGSVERDQAELELLTALGACRQALDGYTAPPTAHVYDRLRVLIDRVPAGLASMQALGAVMTVDGLRAHYDDAIAAAEQLLATASELEVTPVVALCHLQLGWTLLMTGRLVEADDHLDRVHELHDPAWDEPLTWSFGQSVHVVSLAWHGIVAWHLGRFDDARRYGDTSIDEARRIGHPFTLGFALAVGGCLRWQLLHEPERCEEAADEVAELAEREDIEFYRGTARVHRGSAWWQTGRLREGIAESDAGLAAWAELGTNAFATWSLTHRAEAMIRGGLLEEAAVTIAEIERRLAEGEERLAELRLPLVRGMLAAATGEQAGAEEELRRAIELARDRSAGGVELQATVELAALLAELGRADEATGLLTDALDRVQDTGVGHDVTAATALLERS